MSDIKRKKNESFEAFMRRVKQTWQRSGKILEVRKGQHFTPASSKNTRRKSAVTRLKRAAQLSYLKKAGKLPPEEKFSRPKR